MPKGLVRFREHGLEGSFHMTGVFQPHVTPSIFRPVHGSCNPLLQGMPCPLLRMMTNAHSDILTPGKVVPTSLRPVGLSRPALSGRSAMLLPGAPRIYVAPRRM